MFTEVELLDAINNLRESSHSIQTCEKLAAIYTVLDHLYPETDRKLPVNNMYSGSSGPEKLKEYGQTPFLRAIAGKDTGEILLLIDDLMSALQVLNPKLYQSFFEKIF